MTIKVNFIWSIAKIHAIRNRTIVKQNKRYAGPRGNAGYIDVQDILDRLLQQSTGGKYAYCKGKFVLDDPANVERIECRELCDASRFAGIIDRYASRFGEADRRAVVSMWTMYYFSTLAISATIFWLEMRRSLPLALEEVAVCLDPETAEPRCFVLQNAGEEAHHLQIGSALQPLLLRHATPLIAAISENTGVARRLVWSNLVAYFAWIVTEIGRLTDSALEAEGLELLQTALWSEDIPNPMLGLVQEISGSGGVTINRRRVCCLRYLLPGIAGCGEVCPLPGGRC
ncbi:siderophore-iron reductase FhuF [Ciceribacter sp. L1K23]|uniref:siderophore-iron reductase FhuF n=1 Tax=Ciceribacter sp. L1K23 TaxID=2820276 RepID=UPI001BAC4C8A|nr:siderophore-iron reductase FhuF [Ciceribacter sp. L1K23]